MASGNAVRAVAAVDSGQAVNPDGIRNQIEGRSSASASRPRSASSGCGPPDRHLERAGAKHPVSMDQHDGDNHPLAEPGRPGDCPKLDETGSTQESASGQASYQQL